MSPSQPAASSRPPIQTPGTRVLCHHFTAYGCPEDDPYTGIVTRYEESDGGEVQYLTVVFNGHVETYRRVHPDDWTTLDGFGNVVITVARGEG